MSMSKKADRQKDLTKKVLCSLLAAGVLSFGLPMGEVLAAEQVLTGSQNIIEPLDGNKKADILTVTGFAGSVKDVKNFDKVVIKENSVITFNSGFGYYGMANTVTSDGTTDITVTGVVRGNKDQIITLQGNNTINGNVWAAAEKSNITIGADGKKTTISGNVMAGVNGAVKVVLGTADSKIAGSGRTDNNIYNNGGDLEIKGVQGTSVTTNYLESDGGGELKIIGNGMDVYIATTADEKAAVKVSSSSTAILGTADNRLHNLTVSGTGSGLFANNKVGNSNFAKGPDIYVAADNVDVTASAGVAIWAVIDEITSGSAVKSPIINIDVKNLTASGSKGAVIAQDGIVNIGSAANMAENVTLKAVEDNTDGSAVIYVRGVAAEQSTGAVNIFSKNITLEAPDAGTAISGNGGGHEKVNLNASETLNISGSIAGYNKDQQTDGTSNMVININQDITGAGKVTMTGAEILVSDKGSINIKGGADSSLTTAIHAGIANKSGGKININFADGGSITGEITAQNGGSITLAGDITYKGSATVDAGTLNLANLDNLTLDGVTEDKNAVIDVKNGGTLVINENGKLGINGAAIGKTYKLVTKDQSSTVNGFWKSENLAYDRTTMFGKVNQDDYSVSYQVLSNLSPEAKEEAKQEIIVAAGGQTLATPTIVGGIVTNGDSVASTAPGAKAFVGALTSNANITSEEAAAHVNAAAQMGEVTGTSANAISVASNVTGTITGRMSLSAGSTTETGGRGPATDNDRSGASIWAQYVHGKDKVRDMAMAGGTASYDSKYNGFVLGTDFAKVGKFQSGVAFSYGSGDTTSVGGAAHSRNDFDFWGISLYGNMRNADTNLIADIGYSRSDSDIEQKNYDSVFKASPKTDTITLGIKGEKIYQYDNLQVMPYAGLRYMSVDTGAYSSNIAGQKAFAYMPERQNIWLLPVGVSLTYENVTNDGWKIRPNIDVSYMWAMGDTDSSMTVGLPGTTAADRLGYTVMDNGSFIGKLGLEAEKGDWIYGVSYSYQKGSDVQSNKWFVDLKYSF